MSFVSISIPEDYPHSGASNFSWVIDVSKNILSIVDPASQGKTTLSLLGVGSKIYSYAEGTSSPFPFEGKRLEEIKRNALAFIREKPALTPLLRVVGQTILVVEGYKSLYNLITQSSIGSILPYANILICLSNIFLNEEAFLKAISEWRISCGTDQDWENVINITKGCAAMTLQLCQLALFLPQFHVFAFLQAALSHTIFAMTLYGIFVDQSKEPLDLHQAFERPPEILTG